MSRFVEQQEEMLEMLEYLVNLDSGSYDKAGVDQVGTYLAKQYKALGYEVSRYANDKIGDFYRIRHQDASDPEIIVAAHLDTVFPKGTAEKRPFTIKNNRAYGPG